MLHAAANALKGIEVAVAANQQNLASATLRAGLPCSITSRYQASPSSGPSAGRTRAHQCRSSVQCRIVGSGSPFSAGGGASVRLARRIGAPQAKRLMFWGETIPAARALDIGLADMVFPDAQLQDAIDGLVGKLVDKSPLVLRRLKSAINRAGEVNARLALEWERDINELHSHSHDRAEGLAAFAQKRKPKFLGR